MHRPSVLAHTAARLPEEDTPGEDARRYRPYELGHTAKQTLALDLIDQDLHTDTLYYPYMLRVRYTPPRGGEELLGLVAEHVTETLNRSPDDFRPSGVENNTARFLGPVIHDTRGLIQRVEVPLLLTPELRAALFPANAEVSP